ncbi:MAG: hypothetical protein HQK54_07015 [Oligoflexales bacterium]|nr:hypothetical protein [Oligoflexales bacterium]
MANENSYTIEVDAHCHSIATRHAMCTILEVLELAKMKQLKGVVISDHHPSLAHTGEDYRITAPDDAYFSVFCHRFEAIDKSVRLFKGIELNILDRAPWIHEASWSYDHKFDLRLAGIHILPHLFKGTGNASKNTDCVLKAIYAGKKPKFQILAHPHMKEASLDFDEIIKACRERKIALELNNSNILYMKGQEKETRSFVEKAGNLGALIAVSSDSHVPHEVGLFESALSLLEEMRFPPELVVNRTIESFLEFTGSFV